MCESVSDRISVSRNTVRIRSLFLQLGLTRKSERRNNRWMTRYVMLWF